MFLFPDFHVSKSGLLLRISKHLDIETCFKFWISRNKGATVICHFEQISFIRKKFEFNEFTPPPSNFVSLTGNWDYFFLPKKFVIFDKFISFEKLRFGDFTTPTTNFVSPTGAWDYFSCPTHFLFFCKFL